jgi:hypothetical protein
MLIDGDNDIADDIRKALEGGNEPEPVVVDDDPVAAEETTVEEAETPSEGRERGPDGKFVAKPAETEQDAAIEPVKATEAPQESIRVPAGWSPAAKAKFGGLDPDIQKEILKRERDISVAIEGKANELKRYAPLEDVLAPRRAVWAAQGMDEAQAIKTLLAAQDLLERDPKQGLEFLAKSYGVSLAQTQGQPQEAAQPQGNSPQNEQLLARLGQLEQQLQAAQTAPLVSQVEAFFSDPNNLYAENVRGRMANLLNTGEARDLADAYEKACWMDPEIRPLLQTPQIVKDPAHVAKAKAAAVSVTGSPAQPRSAPANANSSIEDDIRNALSELSGAA